ncbi:MAG: hypothetical protein ACPGU6_04940 [Tenacibaculum sp.]
MKKIIAIILLFVGISIQAQDHRKYWKEGKLTWNDFKALSNKNHTSYLYYNLLYKTDKQTINNTIYKGVFADAYINKNLSYVKDDFKDNFYLDYNQVIFNILEINKRKFQQQIFNIKSIFELNGLLINANDHLNNEVSFFQKESNNGISVDIVKRWLAKTYNELEESSDYFIPNYKKSNWTYGMYGGIDFGIQGGDFKDIFNNTLSFGFGFEFSYKKTFLLLNMSLTNSKLNNDLIDNDFLLNKGKRSSIAHLNLSLGYPVYENEKIKVLPFIGYGFTEFSEVGKEKSKQTTLAGTSVLGLNIDFKNKKRVNLTPNFFNIKEEGNSFIRTRVFLSNSNFNPNLKGYSINIGIAYGFEAKSLSVK